MAAERGSGDQALNKRGCGGPAPVHAGDVRWGAGGYPRAGPRCPQRRGGSGTQPATPSLSTAPRPPPSSFPPPSCLVFPFHCFQFGAQIISAYSRQSQSVWQNKKLKQAILCTHFKSLSRAQKEVHQCWNAPGKPDPLQQGPSPSLPKKNSTRSQQ